MGKLDARRLPGFLANPDPECRVVLLHGENAGLAHAHARRVLAAVSGGDSHSVVEVSREAARDPTMLAGEAAGRSLFSDRRRAVWVRDASDSCAAATERALEGSGPGLVVLEAVGDPRSVQRLRRVVEGARLPTGVAIGCYLERGAELSASIRRILTEHGVRADPDAVEWLTLQVAEDHLLLRRELEKLAQYVGTGGKVTWEAAMASAGEGLALDLDEALDAALSGDMAKSDRGVTAAFAKGAGAIQIIRAALRHIVRLHPVAVAVEEGESPRAALDNLRPPVFFRERAGLERALRLWRSVELEAAAAALLVAEARAKQTGAPDALLACVALQSLARKAAASERR